MKQIELNRDGKRSLHQQIYTELRLQILRGDIAAGEALPSYRFMSRKYAITVSTVEKAYDLLEANGYIERRHGSGCYALPLDSFEFYADGVVLDSFEDGQYHSSDVCDFATSTPIAGSEETEDFVRIIQELAKDRSEVLFRYPPTRGVSSLIDAVRTRLEQNGIYAEPESIHIVGGSQQGIDLICKSLISKNTVILAEDPSYSVAANCFRRAGAKILTVPMLNDGPDMDAVSSLLSANSIDYYYTMPQFHCPTNVSWSIEKQHKLLDLAAHFGFTIIEDDCLGELDFSGGEPHSFRKLAGEDSVLYLNSFSKSLVPGMRLGYMVVPGRFEKKLLMAKFNTDIASPAILQETLAVYIKSGAYDAHLKKLRKTYSEKRRHMAHELSAAHYLSLPYTENNGGVFFWVRLPDGIDSMELWNRMRNQNIKLLPGAVFSQSVDLRNFIRLSYVGCTMQQISSGISAIDREVELMRMNLCRGSILSDNG